MSSLFSRIVSFVRSTSIDSLELLFLCSILADFKHFLPNSTVLIFLEFRIIIRWIIYEGLASTPINELKKDVAYAGAGKNLYEASRAILDTTAGQIAVIDICFCL